MEQLTLEDVGRTVLLKRLRSKYAATIIAGFKSPRAQLLLFETNSPTLQEKQLQAIRDFMEFAKCIK